MSQPQHMVALKTANRVRLKRSEAKHRIRAGELSIADALDLDCCQSMRVVTLLCAQWRVALPTARKILKRARIGEATLVCDLTARQRAALTDGAAAPRAPAPLRPRKGSCAECGVRLADPSLGPVCGFCEGERVERKAEVDTEVTRVVGVEA